MSDPDKGRPPCGVGRQSQCRDDDLLELYERSQPSVIGYADRLGMCTSYMYEIGSYVCMYMCIYNLYSVLVCHVYHTDMGSVAIHDM